VVSRAVAHLIELGWVARSANASDRREAPLRLTAAGTEVYRQLVPVVLDYQKYLLARLTTAERGMLERLLGKLERRLDLPRQPERPDPATHAAEAALPQARSRLGAARGASPAERPR
jgi:hypothetical protein